ncbi:E3 ubiquitin-protein ligase BRE1-like 2 [Nicotiana tabacum]|uniref:E3 ubiquitin protein ligase n=3 Tax=Nicotiana TaxID=4085 RepID=A0A1S4A4X4_TOBAC|nr:PREDICTED: E3 ubiquitin-protein ligase BRE1-like 2 [Nicotiana sylvestris]XP_016471693.1 PREDICTED: E3 ubiquitin-protein ligase BRE1-like 2 isoform X1 [Nicotiana tabacum]
MENSAAASDEPQKKRPHLNTVLISSPTMARHSKASSDNKTVDAAVLHYQNQKLVQQLDAQKHKLHDLEAKMKELRDRQASYDNFLVKLNRIWNQLDDDLILLGASSGADQIALKSLDHLDYSRGSVPSCPAEEMFLCRVLKTNDIPGDANAGSIVNIKEALDLRHSSTLELMKSLENAIDAQRIKTENLTHVLEGKPSAEDAIILLSKIDDMMKDEANYLRQVIDVLHLKHKEYADAIEACNQSHSVDQSELKRLEGELEESMSELEDSRRKLVTLKMQKDLASGGQVTVSSAVNGSMSPEKPTDRTKGVRELKESIEEAKALKEDRLSELQDAQEDNLHLLKQLQDLQNELKDDRYVSSSRAYTLLHDQRHHWNAEAERYKALTDSLQADRSFIVRKEKELVMKAEAMDSARKAVDNSESRIEELEHRMHRCIIGKNELEIKMEEAIQDAGRKDIKEEFQVMGSALSKEIQMMEAQLNRWKETAKEAVSLREERQSLEASIGRKATEHKNLINKCAHQTGEIRTLKELAEKMQRDKQERQIFLDMLGQQIYDNRDITEIRESEKRAHAQAEILRAALNEHDLELRVKAANEAEAACQQRLSAAEAEIAELRAELDASDRGVLELREAIKIKEGESETYISEIETIGQAYEDMQTQNQHLLQQLAERDDYNIKLVSESVKIKQEQSLLLSRKQVSTGKLQKAKTSLESLKMRMAQSEDQMKVHITEALSYIQEDRHLAVTLETAKRELGDADKELKWLRSAASSADKEYEQLKRKLAEIGVELGTERSEKKKLDEEAVELNRTVDELTSASGEAAVQKLQDEINDCKAILKCGVCLDRPKEVVITKCYHLFCNPCIQRNLEIRHRKCPACGTAFGQNDVRFVKI